MSETPKIVNIDVSRAYDAIQECRKWLDAEQMQTMLSRVMNESARKVKTIVKKEIAKDYFVTQKWVADAMRGHTVTDGPMPTLTIPVVGPNGLHGPRFQVMKRRSGSRFRVKMLRDRQYSEIPERLERQGGNKPFMMQNPYKAGQYLMMTRNNEINVRGKRRLVRVGGISPGEPMSEKTKTGGRTRLHVQEQIVDYMIQRIEHQANYLFNGGK